MDLFPIKAIHSNYACSQMSAPSLYARLSKPHPPLSFCFFLCILVFIGCGRTPEGFVDPELESNIERLRELPNTDPFHFEVQKYLLNASKANSDKDAVS